MLRTAMRTRPCEGETRNGDRAVVRHEGERCLAAVVDALGHGPVAAEIADAAERVLMSAPLTLGLVTVLEAVHGALRGTRGAAVTAVLFDGTAVEVVGVGNVALHVYGTTFAFAPTPGIVGVRIRTLKSRRAELRSGTRLVLHSDGVSSRIDFAEFDRRETEESADRIFDRHARNHDDATLVIVDRI